MPAEKVVAVFSGISPTTVRLGKAAWFLVTHRSLRPGCGAQFAQQCSKDSSPAQAIGVNVAARASAVYAGRYSNHDLLLSIA